MMMRRPFARPFARLFARPIVAGAAAAALALLLVLAVRGGGEEAPAPPAGFDPAALQRPGLDAPFVSTEHEAVEAMLDLGEVGTGDYVIDLGSGDGRILIAAARDRGARGLGVDIDPARIRDARFNANHAGVLDRVRFREQDLFVTPLAEADVLTLYLLPEINMRLRPRILAEMRPGTRVVSNTHDMGEWRPDGFRGVGNAHVFMWIVPARVDGRWALRLGDGRGAVLALDQSFQTIEGTLTPQGGRTVAIEQGRIEGERIRFVADVGGRRLFEGRMEDGAIVPAGGAASLPIARASGWRAVRER